MITKSRINRAQIMGLLLPGLLIFGMFTVYPIIRLFWMSLCDMSFSSMLIQPFAGIMNYQEVFNDSTFWTVFVNSIVYTLVTVPGQMALGLFIAILLNSIKRFSVAFRVINYLPVVTSWVIASLVFRYRAISLLRGNTPQSRRQIFSNCVVSSRKNTWLFIK